MSDNLKVAKECGAMKDGDTIGFYTLADFEAYTSRILASQQAAHDAEIARLKENFDGLKNILHDTQKELSAANAACAMKDEALKEIAARNHVDITKTEPYASAISATHQQVSEWETKKQAQWNEESNSLIGQQDIEIETLRAQVAYLCEMVLDVIGEKGILAECINETLSNAKATADQYKREIEAKALDYVTNRMEKKLSKAGTFSSGMHSTSQVLLLLNEAEAELFSDAHTTLKKVG